MKYDAMYFIAKFDAIPDEKWTTRIYEANDQYCALGHCGVRDGTGWSNEASTLFDLFHRHLDVGPASINDCSLYFEEFICNKNTGDTPKERIINALLLINAGVKL